MVVDYHTHSNYSDGTMMWRMLRAAEDAGLDGIGFADHCNVSDSTTMKDRKRQNGFNLDITYERRRNAIQDMNDRFDITVYDAVETDYHPDDLPQIQSFLNEAGFDYTVGSIHHVEVDGTRRHIMAPHHFDHLSDTERDSVVDVYVSYLVDMIESGVVDIVAHMDVFERNPVLRGHATDEHYTRIADVLAAADCVPEINGGRLLSEYGTPHPSPDLLELLIDRGIRFTFGTDTHTPDDLRDTVPALQDVFADQGVEPHTLSL